MTWRYHWIDTISSTQQSHCFSRPRLWAKNDRNRTKYGIIIDLMYYNLNTLSVTKTNARNYIMCVCLFVCGNIPARFSNLPRDSNWSVGRWPGLNIHWRPSWRYKNEKNCILTCFYWPPPTKFVILRHYSNFIKCNAEEKRLKTKWNFCLSHTMLHTICSLRKFLM